MRLVLASTSPYRRELLGRLRLPFDVARPDTDETPLAGEAPAALAARLAPGAWVLGSDQVAELDGAPLGKSGGREAAIAQLASMSGRTIAFHTGVCLLRGGKGGDDAATLWAADVTRVRFRRLDPAEIARYVDAEQPFDCAGSFKSEGLGIALFDGIESSDPTALSGCR